MTYRRAPFVVVLTLALGCGSDSDKSNGTPDACSGGNVTVDVVGPTGYTCHQHFRATITVTNGTCQAITVGTVSISAEVTGSTGGTCTPAGLSTYNPVVTSIGAGRSSVVQDITGGAFCCFNTVCPATFTCDEAFTYSVVTSAGTVEKTLGATHIDLSGCDVICQ